MPVHSMTMSMPSDLQGSFLGSRSASTLIGPNPDVDAIAVDLDLAREAPVHAVMAQQVGVVLGGEQIIDGDDFRSLRLASTMARRTLRPMRPKPEIAILTAIRCSICLLLKRMELKIDARLLAKAPALWLAGCTRSCGF